MAGKSKFWSMHGHHKGAGCAFESGFEKKFLDQCYMQGIKVTRCPITVPYVDSEGKARTFVPDFYWPRFRYVVEIKGSWAVRSNHAWVAEKTKAAQLLLPGRFSMMTEHDLKAGAVARLHRGLVYGGN